MQATSKPNKKPKQPTLLIDDTLKEHTDSSPLFVRKIEKATQITSRVRAKQAKWLDTW